MIEIFNQYIDILSSLHERICVVMACFFIQSTFYYGKMLLVLLLSFPVILPPFLYSNLLFIYVVLLCMFAIHTISTMSVPTVSKFKTICEYLQKLQLNFRVKVDHLFSFRLIFDLTTIKCMNAKISEI